MRLLILIVTLGAAFTTAARAQTSTPRPQFNTAGAGVRQTDVEAETRLICPGGKVTHAKDGSVSGCGGCPKETDFSGNGRIAWELYAATPGHFTSAHDNNLLLDGQGCDSDASNNGGTFVFVMSVGKARLLRYEKGLITDQCQKFAYADGRDGLVCRGGHYLQGEGDQSVFVASFLASGKSATTTLINARDTTGLCGDDGTQVVQQSKISEIQFSSKAPGAPSGTAGESAPITGLRIKAEIGEVKCSQVASAQKTKAAPVSVRSYIIEYTFDGKQLRVAPSSRESLNHFATR